MPYLERLVSVHQLLDYPQVTVLGRLTDVEADRFNNVYCDARHIIASTSIRELYIVQQFVDCSLYFGTCEESNIGEKARVYRYDLTDIVAVVRRT